MTQANHINRRKALTIVAAVPAAVALAAVPVLAGEDAELLELGEQCKALAKETAHLDRLFRKACRQQERAFYKMKPEWWRGRWSPHPVAGEANAWEVELIDWAPNHFDAFLDIEPPERLPSKWIRLTADNREDAEQEAAALDRKLDAEFYKKREQAGVAFDHSAHYKNWCRSHCKLERAVARLAKLKATTVGGLNVKALVLAIARGAFDDPNIWNEPLQKSITRGIKSMAGGVDLLAQVERG